MRGSLSHAAAEAKPLDPDIDDALTVLITNGLPAQPRNLAIHHPVWAGEQLQDIASFDVDPDGTLRLEATPPNDAALVRDPQDWYSEVFTTVAGAHGKVSIEKGASTVIRATIGALPSTTAQLIAWQWRATPAGMRATVWAAPMRFSHGQLPLALMNRGNLVLAIDDALVRGWRFSTARGDVFLIPNGGEWYLVVGAVEAEQGFPTVSIISSAIGFVLGEPFALGLFRPINKDRVVPGLVNLGRPGTVHASEQRRGPALPFDCHPTCAARFVDAVVQLAETTPEAPIVRSINLYFASASGFIESKFLHAWLALETLAKWAIQAKRVQDGGPVRLAGKAAWLRWVKRHRAEIAALALPGKEQSLISRVENAECDRPTKVQRAFRGLGIAWTPDMADVERVRHGVAHEGAMSDGPVEADRDRARIGTVNTMHTALLASLANFQGPIADRAKLSITENSVPAWWKSETQSDVVEFRGRRVAGAVQALATRLEQLASQQGPPNKPLNTDGGAETSRLADTRHKGGG